MQLIRTVAAGVAVLMCGALPAHAQTKRAIVLDDQAKERFVRDPELSPDGKWVAYAVTTTDVEKDKRNSRRLDGELGRHTAGAAHVQPGERIVARSGAPTAATSPSSRRAATRDEKKKGAQVWLLNRAGGEALKLTDVKGGVDDYAWSPDGKRLALAVDDPDPNDEPEKKEGWKRKTEPPIVIDRATTSKRTPAATSVRSITHLALFDVGSRRHSSRSRVATFDDEQPSWSPDGTQIAFVSNRNADPDRTTDTEHLCRSTPRPARRRGSSRRTAGPTAGVPRGAPTASTSPTCRATSRASTPTTRTSWRSYPSAGGDARVLTAALDRRVRAPEWSADGKSILRASSRTIASTTSARFQRPAERSSR